MRIAVASTDGVTISRHFGASQCFVVFDMDGSGKITGKEVRQNTFTAHANGECSGDHQHHEHTEHSHSAVIQALRDCDAILCHGMGCRAAQELEANGTKAYVLTSDCSPEEAAMRFVAGELGPAGEYCQCHNR